MHPAFQLATMVQNGSVFSLGVVNAEQYRRVLVPKTSAVLSSPEPGIVTFRLEKRLSFFGHPEVPMTLDEARSCMGLALLTKADEMALGCWGEWSSFEGGADLRVVVEVPPGLSVVRKAELEGPESRANANSRAVEKPEQPNWFGSRVAPGWTPLPEQLDSTRSALLSFGPLDQAADVLVDAEPQLLDELREAISRSDLDALVAILLRLGDPDTEALCRHMQAHPQSQLWTEEVAAVLPEVQGDLGTGDSLFR
jgi:hypothetical protein